MSDWWTDGPEERRVLAEERLVVKVAERLSIAIERTGTVKKELAARLGIKPAELSQRISGSRNLTLRSLAAMAHELGFDVEINLRPIAASAGPRPAIASRRTMDWPAEDLHYTQTGVAIRGIAGHSGAA